jgi:hypothetical protein
MKRRSVIKSLQIAGYLTTGLYAGISYADWSQKHPYGGYNQGYGDFPPADIDKQLSATSDESATAQSQPLPVQNTDANVNQQPATASTAQPQQQAVQQPVYGGYYQNQMPYGAQPYNNRGSSFSGPWNNNRSGFSGPWNNNRSGFSGPWNNRGSGFSGPWNGRNSGPSFSGPWNNNGSSFGAPWNNDRSGFSPWGNGGGWSW